ncbi:MAG: hypothetical protein ACON4G_01610 [Candidatus Puniceispirillaceae bacterium]
MDKDVKKIRSLRKGGSQKLTKLRDELTDMAWDLTEKNHKLKDPKIDQTLVLVDKSLVEIEKALSQLNSIWLVDKSVAKVKADALHNYKF